MTKNYRVANITNEDDAQKLVNEINEVPGTQGVEVDATTGRVRVTGEGFSDALIEDAVESAGFSLLDD
ncbi:heavy-metal-associated domain-containing protein [Corynebacterium breve]|uniref:Heavy-metal-associated domain-containing protein n=1 Tax=Corynebacterium breve TaxID=3049799 RepID=A0ABY8VH77_9CORY|nr:heavy-metal-associated domain-containing protein [Corynebacterium breve]WIM67579.1 heavy-metal-associated domain-containing protein [Corynebacterium breve]